PAGKMGDITIWGGGGKSINEFKGTSDTTSWLIQKDRTDVDYYSNMGAIGATHRITLGSRSGIYRSDAYSGIDNGRESKILTVQYVPIPESNDKLSQARLSFSTYYFSKHSPKFLLKAGTILNREKFAIDTKQNNEISSQTEILHQGDA